MSLRDILCCACSSCCYRCLCCLLKREGACFFKRQQRQQRQHRQRGQRNRKGNLCCLCCMSLRDILCCARSSCCYCCLCCLLKRAGAWLYLNDNTDNTDNGGCCRKNMRGMRERGGVSIRSRGRCAGRCRGVPWCRLRRRGQGGWRRPAGRRERRECCRA